MNEVVRIEIPVAPATAEALADDHRRAAVGRLIDRLMLRGTEDPLAALLEATSAQARDAGLTDEEIDEELAAYNAERRT
jgi:hypothetical protein